MLLPLVGKFCVFFQITGGELEKNTKFAHIFVVIHASQIVGNFCVFFQITGCELENDTKTAHLGEELKFSCWMKMGNFCVNLEKHTKNAHFKKSQKTHFGGQFLCQFGKTHKKCPLLKKPKNTFWWAIFVSIWKFTQKLPTLKLAACRRTLPHARCCTHSMKMNNFCVNLEKHTKNAHIKNGWLFSHGPSRRRTL